LKIRPEKQINVYQGSNRSGGRQRGANAPLEALGVDGCRRRNLNLRTLVNKPAESVGGGAQDGEKKILTENSAT